jgi:hypothetical protein
VARWVVGREPMIRRNLPLSLVHWRPMGNNGMALLSYNATVLCKHVIRGAGSETSNWPEMYLGMHGTPVPPRTMQ